MGAAVESEVKYLALCGTYLKTLVILCFAFSLLVKVILQNFDNRYSLIKVFYRIFRMRALSIIALIHPHK